MFWVASVLYIPNPFSARLIDLGITDTPASNKAPLHYCAARESTSENIPVHYNCKGDNSYCERNWCSCKKADTKWSVACHGREELPGISTMAKRTQKCHHQLDLKDDHEGRRQRCGTAGRWVASKCSPEATVRISR